MIIALDYDETFTADKELWSLFAHTAKQRGHSISFVTFRVGPENQYRGEGNEDIEADARLLEIPIVYCNHKQKSTQFKADIWIDDMPILIPAVNQLDDMLTGCLLNGDTDHAIP